LQNAIKYGCKKRLIASTSSEYGRSLENFKSVNINTIRKPDNYYSLSKFYFTNEAIKLATKHKCKARIMRIFPVYGNGEDRERLYTLLKNAAKGGKDFKIKNPLEVRDFSKVEYVCKVLIDAINFKKKKFKNSQIWHVSENNIMTIKKFSQNVWNDFNGKGKLIFDNNYNQKNKKRHVSLNSSRWK
jgi:nucleoside-diphosphate-sugar epimerase